MDNGQDLFQSNHCYDVLTEATWFLAGFLHVSLKQNWDYHNNWIQWISWLKNVNGSISCCFLSKCEHFLSWWWWFPPGTKYFIIVLKSECFCHFCSLKLGKFWKNFHPWEIVQKVCCMDIDYEIYKKKNKKNVHLIHLTVAESVCSPGSTTVSVILTV